MPPKGSGRNTDTERRPRGIELRGECAVAPAIRAECTSPTLPLTDNIASPEVWLQSPLMATVSIKGGMAGVPRFCSRHGLEQAEIMRVLSNEIDEHHGWRALAVRLEDRACCNTMDMLLVRWEDSAQLLDCEVADGLLHIHADAFRSVGVPTQSTAEQLEHAVRRKLGIATSQSIEAIRMKGGLRQVVSWDDLALELGMRTSFATPRVHIRCKTQTTKPSPSLSLS